MLPVTQGVLHSGPAGAANDSRRARQNRRGLTPWNWSRHLGRAACGSNRPRIIAGRLPPEPPVDDGSGRLPPPAPPEIVPESLKRAMVEPSPIDGRPKPPFPPDSAGFRRVPPEMDIPTCLIDDRPNDCAALIRTCRFARPVAAVAEN